MSSLRLAVLVLGAFAVTETRGQDRAAEDRKRLEGTWVIVSGSLSGKPDEAIKGVRFVFTATEVRLVRDGKRSDPVVYKVDPAASPKRIDFEEKVPPTAGYYELDGDRLRLCYGAERPAEFKPGDSVRLLVLERERPQK
jgi:uncharacterized protein (TIGR03067 family)